MVPDAQLYHSPSEILSDSVVRIRYKQVVNELFKEDELFVLFYLNLALVVDPTQDTQIVETITTDNPWESLTKFLQGKSNIYFCPSGSQLNRAIEYMPCPLDQDILMSDRYGMYRLSSPEELFKNRGESFRQSKHKAVVFGGLKYDEMSGHQVDNLLAFRGQREAVNGYEYLRSTYEEAIYIDSIFRKNGIETALLTGENGTEDSFAQIPSSHADILHIASHGEYNPDKDNLESSSLQEWMMSHSWLALSGADNDAANGRNDGKLTAYEISQTDLTGVNLVVLSACDTGLGDVKENDVYGLLRGFKDAGAGTLMVSLSEVSDTVTSLLMKRFYENLFRGDNPRRALENAQRYIRLYGRGQFNAPDYWAAFILVDDLDRNLGLNVSANEKNFFMEQILRSKDIYDTDFLFPEWSKIKKCLKKDEAVVRFCPYLANSLAHFVALIGTQNAERCQVVRLFTINKDGMLYNGRDLQEIGIRTIFDRFQPYNRGKQSVVFSACLDSLIGVPLISHLHENTTVFFQPAGFLNEFPLENLPCLWGRFQMRRLTSMNVLFDRKSRKRPRFSNVAIFGGISYNAPLDSFKYSDVNPLYELLKLRLGASLSYLDCSEIDSIMSSLISLNSLNIISYKGASGTETAFRNLSHSPHSIIHILTHNYYGLPNGISHISIKDRMLNNSILFWAGFNNIQPNSPVENDGVSLGAEISRMDLKGTHLLTFSNSIETIWPSDLAYWVRDNPWSLITAFKEGGVESLLCACWSPSDQAAMRFMTLFYKYLVDGYPMTEAIQKVRNNMLNRNDGTDDLIWRDWAAFILLDALD